MYQYRNEDVAWQRQIDIQREVENSRIWATRSANLLVATGRLVVMAWLAAGRAAQRPGATQPPGKRAGVTDVDGGQPASRSEAA